MNLNLYDKIHNFLTTKQFENWRDVIKFHGNLNFNYNNKKM